MSDEPNTSGGGRSLGGGSNEPLPASWSRPQSSRIGRVGDWSGYVVFRKRHITMSIGVINKKTPIIGIIAREAAVQVADLVRSGVCNQEVVEGAAAHRRGRMMMMTTMKMKMKIRGRAGSQAEKGGKLVHHMRVHDHC